MNIVVSANNNKEIFVLPVVPTDIEIHIPQNNEEFQTINSGTLNLIGDVGLRTLSISSIFPTHQYKWLKAGSNSNGWEYVEFLNRWRKAKVPIRIVITRKDGSEVLNMACTIESFIYGLTRNEDIRYTLDLKEYKFVKVV
ncbi:phage portal protein [Crassaminicella thermophila]|uniref:Phage portal protein n=1 Tax=Crassaminicella thermophila TaxID=2599308 RepID=A0A5C0SFK8_CRATE|nr:phage portal protein [Crassaminicella thermophila]QEK12576.1 phage portal protein [Crassaminicella thermophila]